MLVKLGLHSDEWFDAGTTLSELIQVGASPRLLLDAGVTKKELRDTSRFSDAEVDLLEWIFIGHKDVRRNCRSHTPPSGAGMLCGRLPRANLLQASIQTA